MTSTTARFVELHAYNPNDLSSVINIALPCICMPLFSEFIYFCIQITKQNRAHRAPYVVLAFACVSIVIRSGLWLAAIIESNMFPGNFIITNTLWTALYFLNFWSYITLYTAFALVAYDRLRANTGGVLPLKALNLYRVLLGLLAWLMLLGAVAATFSAFSVASQDDFDYVFFIKAALLVLGGCVSVYQVVLTVYVYKEVVKVNKCDKVTVSLSKIIAPLSAVGMLLAIVFTFLPILFVADLAAYLTFAIMGSFLIQLGRKPELWIVPEDNIEPTTKP